MKTIGKYLIGAYVSLSLFALLLPSPFRITIEVFILGGIVAINMVDNKLRRRNEVIFLGAKPSSDVWDNSFGERREYRELKEINDLNTAFFATSFLWFYTTAFSVIKYFIIDIWLGFSVFTILLFLTIPIPFYSFQNYLNSYNHLITPGVKVKSLGNGTSFKRYELNKFSSEIDNIETYVLKITIEETEFQLKGDKKYLESIRIDDELYLYAEKDGQLKLIKLGIEEDLKENEILYDKAKAGSH